MRVRVRVRMLVEVAVHIVGVTTVLVLLLSPMLFLACVSLCVLGTDRKNESELKR